jgi:hypothetical protein
MVIYHEKLLWKVLLNGPRGLCYKTNYGGNLPW